MGIFETFDACQVKTIPTRKRFVKILEAPARHGFSVRLNDPDDGIFPGYNFGALIFSFFPPETR
jgi:hypothetical protein